ncbi:MAG: hypothetical protein H0T86_03895 [Gemmatimonadales bacterium]|nr:hypothetical protein [Gemmatimonadales bacterium]
MTQGREMRLKSEHAGDYPDIPAGCWLSAREISELLVSRARANRASGVHQRTFVAPHFEFRGGEGPRGVGGKQQRTRATD